MIFKPKTPSELRKHFSSMDVAERTLLMLQLCSGNHTYNLKYGDIKEVVEVLVEDGVYINAQNNKALVYSVKRGLIDICRILIKAGADPNQGNPIFTACLNENIAMVRLLLEAGADPNVLSNDPLKIALQGGNEAMVRLLIEYGADVENVRKWCITHNMVRERKLLDNIKQTKGVNESLFKPKLFIPKSKNEIRKSLEMEGVDINKYLISTILLAPSFTYSLPMLKALLDAGADPNYNDGEALLTAVTYSNEQMCRLLLQYGADVNIRNHYDVGILERACDIDYVPIIKMLLDSGIKVSDKALKNSVYNCSPKAIHLLLKYGANGDKVLRELKRDHIFVSTHIGLNMLEEEVKNNL